MALKTWLHALGAAFIGGAANAITLLIVDPLRYNLGEWKTVAAAALISGIVSAAFYLRQRPLPEDEPKKE